MTSPDDAGLVLLLARALAAASEGRVSTPALTAACRAAFPAWHVTPGEIGAILSAAGWEHRQWRERRGNPAIRVRGYAVPGEVGGKVDGWGNHNQTAARASETTGP